MFKYQAEVDFYKKEIQTKTQDKYKHWGIYGIYIQDKLVYIGKSSNMLTRVANHCFLTSNLPQDLKESKSNKYKVLNQAICRGYKITFDVLCYTKEDEDSLGLAEAEQIHKYMPKLNTQIPKLGDYRHYQTNHQAQTITLDEIMGGTRYEF